MKTFESFIENDAFFPILIILLIILIAVFIWIVISNKQEEQKKRAQRQLLIDESAEIKILDNNHRKVELKDMEDIADDIEEEEPERNEIAIVQEVSSVKHDNNKNKNKNEHKHDEDQNNNDNEKDDIKDEYREDEEFKKVDVQNEKNNQDNSIKVPGLFKEEVADIENIDVHLNPENEIEEVELPMVKDELEEKAEEIVEEEVKPEMTEEEKAIEDAFALPDLDNIFDEKNIEGEIIEAANQYIAEIMKKEDN